MKVVEYKLSELLAKGDSRQNDDDAFAYGDPRKLQVIAANPFLHGEDIIARMVVYADDGKPGAAEYRWPVEIVADGAVYAVECGGEAFSRPEYRKDALGLNLWLQPPKAPYYLSSGCGVAQITAKIMRCLGRPVFPVPRYIALFKSFSVVSMRINGAIGKLLAWCIDQCLSVWWMVISAFCRIALRGLKIVEICNDNAEAIQSVGKLVETDNHRFRENHTADWFVWHTKYAFHKYGPCRLFGVYKHGVMIGFYMTKRKFYETASSRGLKNLWLGSVLEWGSNVVCASLQKWLVLRAIMSLRKTCDAVEVTTVEKTLAQFLRRRMMMHVGDSNFRITAGELSPLRQHEGWDEIENWRIRPAMCDNGIG